MPASATIDDTPISVRQLERGVLAGMRGASSATGVGALLDRHAGELGPRRDRRAARGWNAGSSHSPSALWPPSACGSRCSRRRPIRWPARSARSPSAGGASCRCRAGACVVCQGAVRRCRCAGGAGAAVPMRVRRASAAMEALFAVEGQVNTRRNM